MNNIFMCYSKEIPDYVFKKWNSLNKNLNLQIFNEDSFISYAESNFEPYFNIVIKNIKQEYKTFLFGLLCLYYNGGIYINPDYYPEISPTIIFESKKSDCFFVLKKYNTELEQNFFACKEKYNPFILSFITNICNKYYNPKNSFTTLIDLLGKMLPRSIQIKNNKKIPVIFHKSIFLHNKHSTKNVQFNKFPINLSYYQSINCKVLKNTFNAKFKSVIKKNKLIIKREDNDKGWEFELNLEIGIKKKINVELLNSSKDDFTKIYSIFFKDEKIFNEKYSTTDIYEILNPDIQEQEEEEKEKEEEEEEEEDKEEEEEEEKGGENEEGDEEEDEGEEEEDDN